MSDHEIRIPGGMTAFDPRGNATKTQRIVDARHKFNVAYCEKKGWASDPAELTFEQIMEIRSQPEWINAGKS